MGLANSKSKKSKSKGEEEGAGAGAPEEGGAAPRDGGGERDQPAVLKGKGKKEAKAAEEKAAAEAKAAEEMAAAETKAAAAAVPSVNSAPAPAAAAENKGSSWFSEVFGFEESRDYSETQAQFRVAEAAADASHTVLPADIPAAPMVLTTTTTGKSFHVGPFETPSVAELEQRLEAVRSGRPGSGIAFTNIGPADVRALHKDDTNAGAVFMVASQFNCLEMVGPRVTPEQGVTRYASDMTQGPACAMSCPAGTVYRNYFHNGGQGGGEEKQVNTLATVGEVLAEGGNGPYWNMSNGYAMPVDRSSIRDISARLDQSEELRDRVRLATRGGVHWDTEVFTPASGEVLKVCQVFASALPVAYARRSATADEWAPFATAVLEGAFDLTLLTAALLARARGERVTVYLTSLGGGAFGNRVPWIISALRDSLQRWRGEELDVVMVHYGSVPQDHFPELERDFP